MEEILKQILGKLGSLEQGQQELKEGFVKLESRQARLEEGQESIWKELAAFRSEAKEKFAGLNKQTETTAITVARHTAKLDKISIDLEYLIDKEKHNEREIYALKTKMKAANN